MPYEIILPYLANFYGGSKSVTHIQTNKNTRKQTEKIITEDPLIAGTAWMPSGSGPIVFPMWNEVFQGLLKKYWINIYYWNVVKLLGRMISPCCIVLLLLRSSSADCLRVLCCHFLCLSVWTFGMFLVPPHKSANYGWISNFMVSTEVSWQNSLIYQYTQKSSTHIDQN